MAGVTGAVDFAQRICLSLGCSVCHSAGRAVSSCRAAGAMVRPAPAAFPAVMVSRLGDSFETIVNISRLFVTLSCPFGVPCGIIAAMSSNAVGSQVCDKPGQTADEPGALSEEARVLGERISELSRAFLVSETPSLNTIMQGAIDRATALADAKFGALLTFDDSGSVRDVFTSGDDMEEREAVEETAPARLSPGPARPAKRRGRILVADHDSRTLRQTRDALQAAGYLTIAASDPDQVESLVRGEEPDLVLLDLALPDVNGIELMERIRQITDVPVVFLIDPGAGEFVVKPFSPAELVAKIGAILHRRTASSGAGGHQPYRSGELVIDYGARLVTVAGRPVRLTPTEYRLAVELSANAGHTMTQDQLLTGVWGAAYSGESQVLRTFIRKLRRKLGDSAGNPAYIFTEPRVGYRMAMSESRQAGHGD